LTYQQTIQGAFRDVSNALVAHYLEVLTNDTNSLTAELGLAQARGNELIALVQLYQALGGGWE